MGLRIAVFASGNGSNFQAVVDAIAAGRLDATVGLVVCDKPKAPVVEKARQAGIPLFVFDAKNYASREQYETQILRELEARNIGLIVLAGYMRLLTDTLVKPYYGRMINVHPALLPAFPGADAVRQALAYGVKLTGATVHFVDSGMDTGPIIAQRAVEVHDDDQTETLLERIHGAEKELLPQVIDWISKGRVLLQGRKVTIK